MRPSRDSGSGGERGEPVRAGRLDPDVAEDLRRELETTELLLDAGKALSATVDLTILLARLAEIALRFTNLPRAFVNMIDMDRRVLVPMVATGGLVAPVEGAEIGFGQLSETSLRAIVAEKTAILDYEAPGIPQHDREIAQANHSRLVLFVPLIVRGEIVGHISLDQPDERHPFSDREIALVEGIAAQAAIAIQNVRLFEAEVAAKESAARELETTKLLLDGASILADSTELGTGVRSLIATMRAAIPGIRAVVYELSEARQELKVLVSGGEPAPPDGTRLPLSKMTAAATRIIETNTSEVIDFDALPKEQRGIGEQFSVHLLHAVPLVYRDRALGIVVADDPSQPRRTFSKREVELIEAFASQVAAALEHARLLEALERRVARLATLQRLSALVNSSLSMRSVVTNALEHVVTLLDVAAASLWVVDTTGDRLRLQGATGFSDQFFADYEAGLPVDAPHDVAKAFTSGKVVVHEDAFTSDVATPVREAYGRYGIPLGSLVAVPLRSPSGIVGGLTLAWNEPRPFTDDDRAFDLLLADTFAIALENARLFEAETERALRGEMLHELAELAAASLDAAEIADRAFEFLTKRIGVDYVHAYTINDQGDTLDFLAGKGATRTFYDEVGRGIGLAEPLEVVPVFKTCRPVVRADASDPEVPQAAHELYERSGMRLGSYFALPLIAKGEALGVMVVAWTRAQEFSHDDVEFYAAIANELATALQNARLYQAELRRTVELQELFEERTRRSAYAEALNDVNRVIASTLEPGHIVRRAMHAGIRALGMDAGTVEVREGHTWAVRFESGFGPEVVGLVYPDEEAVLARHATEYRRPFTVADVAQHHELRVGFLGDHALRSLLAVPLVARGEVTGCLLLGTRESVRQFTEEDIDFAEKFAAPLSAALDNGLAYEAAVASRSLAETELETTRQLLGAADALASKMSLPDVLDALCETTLQALQHSRVTVGLWRDGSDYLETAASTGLNPIPLGVAVPVDGLSATAQPDLATLESTIIDSDALEARGSGTASGFTSRLALAIPLVYRMRFLGMLVIDDGEDRREFTQREVAIGEGVAAEAAVAIENARLFESEQKRAEQLAVLKTVAEAASSSLDLSEAAKRIACGVAIALEAKQVQLRLLSGDGRSLDPVGTFDPAEFLQVMGAMSVDADTATSACFCSGKARILEDIATDDVSAESARSAKAAAIRSAVLLPVLVDDQPIGTFYAAWDEPRHFTFEEVSFIESVVTQFTVGLQNARLYEQQAEQMQFATALNGINAVVHGALDFDEIMDQVVIQLTEAMGADAVGIHMRGNDTWAFEYEHGVPAGLRDGRLTDAEARVSAQVRETREMFVAHDVLHDSRANAKLSRRFGTKALLAVPLIARDEVVAVMLIFRFSALGGFSDAQVDFARKVAVTLGLATENARLYEAEHRIADRLQDALLAMPETVEGVEFSYAYHSASDATRVGGDFYDIFELDERHVGVTIGDVAGKGLDAAVLTSLTKNTIRAHASEHGKTPAKILELTNQVVYQGTSTESFVTVFFGVLDRRDGTLTYSNAGHTTCALVRAKGDVVALPATSPIIGAFPNLEFAQAEVRVVQGDSLFLYTDGLTEARLDQLSFAEDRLFEFLGEHRGASTEGMVTEVVDFVMSLTGCRLRDDLAILALRLDEASS